MRTEANSNLKSEVTIQAVLKRNPHFEVFRYAYGLKSLQRHTSTVRTDQSNSGTMGMMMSVTVHTFQAQLIGCTLIDVDNFLGKSEVLVYRQY